MKGYLLTAAGVIFLSVMVSLLMPEGKLNKSITFVMRLICILVLIQPLTGIFNIKSQPVTGNIIDYTYVESVYSEQQSEQLEKLITKEFKTAADCDIKIVYQEGKFKVKEVTVKIPENNSNLISQIYEYLKQFGYINITVYAEST